MTSRFNKMATWINNEATQDELEILAEGIAKQLQRTNDKTYIRLSKVEWENIKLQLERLQPLLKILNASPLTAGIYAQMVEDVKNLIETFHKR